MRVYAYTIIAILMAATMNNAYSKEYTPNSKGSVPTNEWFTFKDSDEITDAERTRAIYVLTESSVIFSLVCNESSQIFTAAITPVKGSETAEELNSLTGSDIDVTWRIDHNSPEVDNWSRTRNSGLSVYEIGTHNKNLLRQIFKSKEKILLRANGLTLQFGTKNIQGPISKIMDACKISK